MDVCTIFKALSDPNRLTVVKLLMDGETCACKLLEKLDITQPTLSHHMGILVKSELVHGRKEGQGVCYFLNPMAIKAIIDFFSDSEGSSFLDETVCDC